MAKGVDMRTLSTDNIEKVEIIRGIPSVAYGNVSNGAVIIQRKTSESPLSARFKADKTSKLFSVGKGIRLDGNGRYILNADVNYLDAKIDPRNSVKTIRASRRLPVWIASGCGTSVTSTGISVPIIPVRSTMQNVTRMPP